MEPLLFMRNGMVSLVLLGLAGCGGGDPRRDEISYSRYQGTEVARLVLSLEPKPRQALLIGSNTPTGNEFLSGVMKACALELAREKVPSAIYLAGTDLTNLPPGPFRVSQDEIRKALQTYPDRDVVVSFAGLPQAVPKDGPRWVVLSSDPPAARKAIEAGQVHIVVVPRTEHPATGSRKKAEDRFAADFEILRAP